MRGLGVRHWWILPIGVTVGALSGVLMMFQNSGREEFRPPSVQLVASSVIGWAVGFFLLSVLVVVFLSWKDAQLRRVQALRPNAVVIRAIRPTPLALDTFAQLTRGAERNLQHQTRFILSFDDKGMIIWDAGRKPLPAALLPWSTISEVAIGDWYSTNSPRSSLAYDQLRVTIVEEGRVLELQVGVETGQSSWVAVPFMNQNQLAALIQRIDDARERVVRIRAIDG